MKHKVGGQVNFNLSLKFFSKKSQINLKKAFSFIEISVVILIVAVTLIGVMQGQEMYYKMRLNSARLLTEKTDLGMIDGLTVWLEATTAKSFDNGQMVDSTKISKWVNLYSTPLSKIDFTQSVFASQPQYYRYAINGLPAVRFDNAQTLSTSSLYINDFASNQEVTIFLVQQSYSSSYSSAYPFCWMSGSIPKTTMLLTNTKALGKITFYFGSFSDILQTSSQLNFLNKNNILTYYKSSANVGIRLNRASLISGASTQTISDTAYTSLSLGGCHQRTGYFFYGHIGEFIVFNRALNNSEIDLVEKYLSEKWGI